MHVLRTGRLECLLIGALANTQRRHFLINCFIDKKASNTDIMICAISYKKSKCHGT